jgi:uncharacterized protein YegP (UPF0339 family)
MKATIAGIFRGKDGWYFRLRSRNGRVIGASQAYTRFSSAKRAALRVAPHARLRVEAP